MATNLEAHSKFTEIQLTFENLEVFYHRRSIFRALGQYLPLFHGSFLDVGCGQMPYKEHILSESKVQDYIGLDIESALEYNADVQPDIRWDGVNMPIEDNCHDVVMATEVLEHCPDPQLVLTESYRVLKNDGIFFFTVPFVWNLHETPYDFYRYTPFALSRHLEKAGYKNIEISVLGNWNASMAQMLGLWMKRSPIRKYWKYRLIRPFLIAFHKKLLALAENEQKPFSNQKMPSGLFGVARK